MTRKTYKIAGVPCTYGAPLSKVHLAEIRVAERKPPRTKEDYAVTAFKYAQWLIERDGGVVPRKTIDAIYKSRIWNQTRLEEYGGDVHWRFGGFGKFINAVTFPNGTHVAIPNPEPEVI
jgi:hypothetical protein